MKIKLLEPNEYNKISPGSMGGLIRRIRELRGLSRGELGTKAGFGSSVSSEVRIRQYEVNINTPRESAIKDLAEALEIDSHALQNVDFSDANNMYHSLFYMELFHALRPVKIGDHYYLEFEDKNGFGQKVDEYKNQKFLSDWHNSIQKSIPFKGESRESINNKAIEYATWQYEYPLNKIKDSSIENERSYTSKIPEDTKSPEDITKLLGKKLGELHVTADELEQLFEDFIRTGFCQGDE